MRLCQNHRGGRDNLDGQGMWVVLLKSKSFVLLPAPNLHHKEQQRGHLLLHGQFYSTPWMESQLDGGDTRSDSLSHTGIIMISKVAMTDQNKLNSCKKNKFYDCVLRLGGSKAKAEKN